MPNINGMYDLNATPQDSMEPIPSGWYQAVIIDCDTKAMKSGNGEYLEITHRVIDGPCKGRLVWARLNLVHRTSAKAQEIAQRQFASVRQATGVLAPNDSAQLHNIPVWIRVEFVLADPNRAGSRDGNEIRDWKKINDPPLAAIQQASSPAIPPLPTGATNPAPGFNTPAPAFTGQPRAATPVAGAKPW